MDIRQRVIRDIEEAKDLHARIAESAVKTVAVLRRFEGDSLNILKQLKFETIGHDPLTHEPLNIVEQLNQTFTILTTLRAIELLFQLHPNCGGFSLALGTCKGRDIESVQADLVAAEVFSATHPKSNRKLDKDMDRLLDDRAEYRYVFFSSPEYSRGRYTHLERAGSGIQVFAVDL